MWPIDIIGLMSEALKANMLQIKLNQVFVILTLMNTFGFGKPACPGLSSIF